MVIPDFVKKPWTWVVGAITLLVGLFLFERKEKLDAEAQLQTANASKETAVLEEQRKQAEKDIQTAEASKAQANVEAKKEATNMTESEIQEFYKKRE